MGSSQSSSAKVGVSIVSRRAAGSSSHRSRLSFSPPWLGVQTRQTPSASSTKSCVQPQGVYVAVVVAIVVIVVTSLSCSEGAGQPPEGDGPALDSEPD